MNLEIHKPELVQRVNAHIQTGQFHDADEVLEKALDALEEKAPVPMSSTERRRAAGRKSLVELFAPLQGLNLDFSRNTSTGRSIFHEPGFSPRHQCSFRTDPPAARSARDAVVRGHGRRADVFKRYQHRRGLQRLHGSP